MNETEEIWAKIEGWDGYEVSSHGRVRSFWKHVGGKRGHVLHPDPQRILKGWLYRKGRLYVNLWKGNKQKHFQIHRLVAIAFIPNPNNHPQIDHIDRNHRNNHVSNLRWCNNQQNNLNHSIQSNNTTGVKGVRFRPDRKKWCAHWVQDGRWKSKSFETKEDALDYRKKMVEEHYDMEFYTEN